MKNRFDSQVLWRALLLIGLAIVVNIAVGRLVREVLHWPLWLDSIGTVLVGALLGPLAGAATGAATNLLVTIFADNRAALPFAITAAFIGWAAGYAGQLGAFQRLWSAALTGLVVGIGAALISAPIATYAFGGLTDTGFAYLRPWLDATGATIFQLTTIQGLISDPLDKLISFVVAWLLWQPLHGYFPPLQQTGAGPLAALRGYSLAVVAALLALLVFIVFLPATGPSIFSVFYLAVLLSAWRGGLGPALLTTAVGAAAIYFFLVAPLAGAVGRVDAWFRLVDFLVVAGVIAVIGDQLQRSLARLQTALQAGRADEARIRAITDSVSEALALISPDQRVLAVNRRFVDLFGVPQERLVGQRLEDLRTLFDQVFEEAEALYNASVATSGDTEQEYTRSIGQKWPEVRELLHYSAPVRSADGFLGRLYVFRDVTREREVDRMKTEFVSLVSHELRTPLTSIKGFTEMVLDGDAGEVNEEVAEYLGIVHSNAERLVALVNDLLDLSRIESGRIQIKAEPVDLGAAVENVIVTLRQKIAEKGQRLGVDVDPAATAVVGDRDKLVQVLTNYVSNAHKYTQAGGDIRVEIRAENGFAHVAIVDNGHGIAPDDQARLFTRFYRVDNELTREVGGTGLGLSIVKQLVELQGGATGVESALGAGSTFWFTVPLAVASTSSATAATATAATAATADAPGSITVAEPVEAATAATADAPGSITVAEPVEAAVAAEAATAAAPGSITVAEPVEAAAATADAPGSITVAEPVEATVAAEAAATTILVVEDNPDVARLIAHHLEQAGHRVRVAHTAEEALAAIAANLPDLITLDLALPALQGEELARRLHDDPLTSDIPILVVSALADDPASLAFGAYVLPKPIHQEELVTTVAQMLQGPQQGPVLVIDDDPDVRRLLEAALSATGLSVELAADGETGLARAAAHPPDLILLDLHLPGMDGFAVLHALKAAEQTADIPVVAISGSPDLKATARARVLALGGADLIAKPFDMGQLVQEIRLFLAARV